MRVILVDDEVLALHHMEKLLESIGNIAIVGKFSHPLDGLNASIQERPDVVFIDINMPELNGIAFAERLQRVYPDVIIVFVTAYDEYAVKAFDLDAVDYIVKPVQRKRLEETVRRLRKRIQIDDLPSDSSGMVCCFQSLRFKKSLTSSDFLDVRWRTSKARELFAFFIQHRERPVRKGILLELLWPEFDEKKGYSQLYITIYQIRKTLASINMNITISSFDNSYMLELNDVKLDVDLWEKGMSELNLETDANVSNVIKTMSLYQGDYLSEDGYHWAEQERERLRILWHHYQKQISEYYISKKNYTDAILLHQSEQMLHPYREQSYIMLMKLYDLLGDDNSVEKQYNFLRKMLEDEYDEKPNHSIEKWYRNWKLKKK
ncbi:response regulator [Fervidibacillus halotolerans]|uniref:Response regulator n=1 Tax=Fervidibacillus halotolerans TaxID=2980027 RepID=A0A9E8RZQ2_9BACI|nr:response regulator [Fervidibacillus halotolerans]WAA11867.1 response regulator [Fervidibacillus halotolerans]